MSPDKYPGVLEYPDVRSLSILVSVAREISECVSESVFLMKSLSVAWVSMPGADLYRFPYYFRFRILKSY
jgi:hypothetical protein